MSKKVLTGKVVSDVMEKTAVVSVEIPKRHPVYHKAIKNTKRFMSRNEVQAKKGDMVIIEESKPYSKNVTWIIKEVVKG